MRNKRVILLLILLALLCALAALATACYTNDTIVIVPDEHEHYNILKYNEFGHMQQCTVCAKTFDYEEHSFSWRADKDFRYEQCSTCKYVRNKTAHEWTNEYDKNEQYHWRICAHCEVTLLCNNNNLISKSDDECHWQECTDCDYVSAKAPHNWKQEYSFDNEEHWYKCVDCDYKSADAEAHQFVAKYDELGHHWLCKVCRYETDIESHNLKAKYDDLAHWQTCDCGYKSDPAPHYIIGSYQFDTDNHWKTCTGCDYETAKEPHKFAISYDESSHTIYCTECGISTTAEHNITQKRDGSGHWTGCEHCDFAVDKNPHTWGETIMADDNIHYKECSECGWQEVSTHNFEWQRDEKLHWRRCSDCGYIKDKQEHKFFDTNVCLYCGYTKSTKGLEYMLEPNGKYAILIGLGSATDTTILIADEYEDRPVERIADDAFSGCTQIEAVDFGRNLTTIGDRAFYGCEKLTGLRFGDKIATIGERTFGQCTALSDIKLPSSLQSIGNAAFSNCHKLCNIVFSEGLITIGDNAFEKCENLLKLELPNSLVSIGAYAFKQNIKVGSIAFGANLQGIGEGAFMKCGALSEINLPQSLITIGDSAFCDCFYLTNVSMKNSVKSIGGYAFAGCNLDKIIYYGTVEEWAAVLKGADWDKIIGEYTIDCVGNSRLL